MRLKVQRHLKNSTEQLPYLIGNTGFKGPPTEAGMVEIGYAILEEFQGAGYATEAVSALMSWAFKNPNITHIAAETFPSLHGSIRVMEKCGMHYIGTGSEEGTIRYYRDKLP